MSMTYLLIYHNGNDSMIGNDSIRNYDDFLFLKQDHTNYRKNAFEYIDISDNVTFENSERTFNWPQSRDSNA